MIYSPWRAMLGKTVIYRPRSDDMPLLPQWIKNLVLKNEIFGGPSRTGT